MPVSPLLAARVRRLHGVGAGSSGGEYEAAGESDTLACWLIHYSSPYRATLISQASL